MQLYYWNNLSQEQKKAILTRPAQTTTTDISKLVSQMITDIQDKKDKALLAYRQRFDKTEPTEPLKLSQQSIDLACSRVCPDVKQAIKQANNNIMRFHKAQKPESVTMTTMSGVKCEQRFLPIECPGMYIPAGTAPLISTVLMLGIPALIAQCPNIILCSPPPIADEIIFAASVCSISEIYAIGGAQAIAGMAFGTETIPKADKIFGPGNAYVTVAKQLVSQMPQGAAIDMPAGPSELLVIADESAQPDFIAADLLSQAEHSTDAQVILVTLSENLATQVLNAITKQSETLPRKKTVATSLKKSRIILCSTLDEAITVSNMYAPEHLSIQTKNPEQLVDRITTAGSIFVGSWTPESAGDYASGTNHVLPTYGYARTYSSLGLMDFMRRFTVQTLTKEGLGSLEKTITTLARAEQLEAHARAVEIRLNFVNSEVL